MKERLKAEYEELINRMVKLRRFLKTEDCKSIVGEKHYQLLQLQLKGMIVYETALRFRLLDMDITTENIEFIKEFAC